MIQLLAQIAVDYFDKSDGTENSVEKTHFFFSITFSQNWDINEDQNFFHCVFCV